MKITIFAAGSRGDIQPCIVLGQGLAQAGYGVQLAVPRDFKEFVQSNGLDFYPLRGDIQAVMASESGREFMETGGGNPLKSIRTMRSLIKPIAVNMADDAHQACQQSDGIICLGVLSAFGESIAEAVKIPLINMEPTPLLPTKDFPAPAWPIQKNFGGFHNYLSGLVMLLLIWLWYEPSVNDFRGRLGLPRMTYLGFLRGLRARPMISTYSPTIIPHPGDWPGNVHVTGYLFMDGGSWEPPIELINFLEAGKPPVYIGFGSMAGQRPQQLAKLAIGAIAQSNQRGILLTGWGGLQADEVPAEIFVADSIPHHWLFPRVAAVVHHGGAGTTAEGLRAGAPTVVVPFAFDQSFWGARVKTIGLGPSPIDQKSLTVDNLASAIHHAATDPRIRAKADEVGSKIRAEDGTNKAVAIVRKYFGNP